MGFGRGGGGRGSGRGGGFRGGNRGGGGGFRLSGSGRGGNFQQGPPERIIPLGFYSYKCEDDLVCKVELQDVPYFSAPIYLENKEQIGKIDEIFGTVKDFSVTIKLSENMNANSFKANQKLFIDPSKLLPISRFLSNNSGKSRGGGGKKGPAGGVGGQRGKRGGSNRGGGSRGNFNRNGRGGGGGGNFNRSGRGGGGFNKGSRGGRGRW